MRPLFMFSVGVAPWGPVAGLHVRLFGEFRIRLSPSVGGLFPVGGFLRPLPLFPFGSAHCSFPFIRLLAHAVISWGYVVDIPLDVTVTQVGGKKSNPLLLNGCPNGFLCAPLTGRGAESPCAGCERLFADFTQPRFRLSTAQLTNSKLCFIVIGISGMKRRSH